MFRNAQNDLLKWYQKKGRMPLILRGARQVGKSTLVRLFCVANHLDLIEINLEIRKIKSLQKEQIRIEDILDEILLLSNRKLTPKSVIFFDEIQEEPKLLSMLRYFFEERPEIAVIAAGSLLEFVINEGAYSFPVGRVEFYHLGPMTFLEFLSACGQEELRRHIEEQKISPATHSLAKEYFKKFIYVGGMPMAVSVFSNTKSLVPVRDVQNQIIQGYLADFPKYSGRTDLRRIDRIFQSSVLQIGKKMIFQAYDRESKSRDIKRVLELLIQAKVLLPCFHSEANGVPMEASKDEGVCKLYFIDVGLLNCMLRLDFEMLEAEIDHNFLTKGMLAEQFVAQHLVHADGPTAQPALYYWLRDKGSQKGEVDFLVQKKGRLFPIEVKAVEGGRLKSLFYFSREKKWKKAIRLSLKEFGTEKISHKIEGQSVQIDLLDLPLYAVETLFKVLP